MYIKDLCFSYAEKVIFDHFSLKLADTGVTAIAGASGCGKTTLLRLIAGLEKPQSGSLHLPPPEQIAFMFQEDRLLPDLCAGDQICVVMPRPDRSLALRYLCAAGLENEYDTPVSELSGGMRRRVALARCLAYGGGKALFIMDEPFTGIDPDRAAGLMAWIRSFAVPVLYSAHDTHSLSLADRVIRLGAGISDGGAL